MTLSQVEAIIKTLNSNDIMLSYYKALHKTLLKQIPSTKGLSI